MADRFFVTGGDGLFGSTSNWGTVTGGAGGSSVPVITDNIILDGNSPASLTINASARAGLSLNTTGWTGTITFDQTLTIATDVTRAATATFTGAAALIVTGTCTFTSNGTTFSIPLTFSGASSTTTLADDLTVTGVLTVSPSGSASKTFNGNTIFVGGGMTLGTSISSIAGTTAFEFNGPGTLACGAAGNQRWDSTPITFDLAGMLVITGIFSIAGQTSLTYVAGTIDASAADLLMVNAGPGGAGVTLDCAAITWRDVTFSRGATHTLADDLDVSQDLIFSVSSGTVTLSGAFDITVGRHLSQTAGAGAVITSTDTTIVLAGTGTWSSTTTSHMRIAVVINTAGTITISGQIQFNTRTLTYTAGTVAFASTPILLVNTATTTFDLNGLVLNCELRQITASITIRLASDMGIGPTGALTLLGTAAGAAVVNSTSGGVQRKLTISSGALIDVGHVAFTDIDCSDGDELFVFKGTRTNTANISLLTPYESPADTIGGGGSGVMGARIQTGY